MKIEINAKEWSILKTSLDYEIYRRERNHLKVEEYKTLSEKLLNQYEVD